MARRSTKKPKRAVETDPACAAVTIASPKDLLALGLDMENWFFRGQSDAGWPLCSSLERSLGVDRGSTTRWRHSEKWMLRQFIGFAHHYLPHPPSDDDLFEWLAIMQHHGAPTRLMDCTFSIAVAAFFAAIEGTEDFAIWAFNWRCFLTRIAEWYSLELDDELRSLDFRRKMNELANDFLRGKAKGALAFPVTSNRSSERLEAQRGLFMFPCDPARSLQDNLSVLFGHPSFKTINDPAAVMPYDVLTHTMPWLNDHWMLKIVIPKSKRSDMLRALWKLNVHEASLFPGLDGFARSLRMYARYD